MTENMNSPENLKIVGFGAGLGNQMFQYAFSLRIPNVIYDASSYQTNHYRSFDLELYDIKCRYATPEQVKLCRKEVKFKNPLPRFLRQKLKMKRYIYLVRTTAVEKRINQYEAELQQRKGPVYWEGAFQTEKYFKEQRPRLLQDLRLKQPLPEENQKMLAKIKSCNAVGVHIRRGDYLNPKGPFVYLDLDYYERAMSYIAKKVENPHFFIFSNDPEWVKANLKAPYPLTIVDINGEKTGYFDLELMRNCRHNIIANSSFSWWGAYLNETPEKIVVAPKQWFKPDAMEYSEDIVPEEWIKM